MFVQEWLIAIGLAVAGFPSPVGVELEGPHAANPLDSWSAYVGSAWESDCLAERDDELCAAR